MSEKLVDLWIEKFGAKSVVSVQEAADLTNVHENTIRKAIDEGSLSSFRAGSKLLRVSLRDLAAWMSGPVANQPPARSETHKLLFYYWPTEGKIRPLRETQVLHELAPTSHSPFPSIKHPWCIQHLKLYMKPLVLEATGNPVLYVNWFASIQSHLTCGYIDIQNLDGESKVPVPVSIANCFPMKKYSPAPEMRLNDAVFLQPDYNNSSDGHRLEDGLVTFERYSDVQFDWKVAPTPASMAAGLGSLYKIALPLELDITIGIYGG